MSPFDYKTKMSFLTTHPYPPMSHLVTINIFLSYPQHSPQHKEVNNNKLNLGSVSRSANISKGARIQYNYSNLQLWFIVEYFHGLLSRNSCNEYPSSTPTATCICSALVPHHWYIFWYTCSCTQNKCINSVFAFILESLVGQTIKGFHALTLIYFFRKLQIKIDTYLGKDMLAPKALKWLEIGRKL